MKHLLVLLACILPLTATAHAQDGILKIEDQEKIAASIAEIKSMRHDAVDKLVTAVAACLVDPYRPNPLREERCDETTNTFIIMSSPDSPTAYLLPAWVNYLKLKRMLFQVVKKAPPPADEVNEATQLAAKWRTAISERYKTLQQ